MFLMQQAARFPRFPGIEFLSQLDFQDYHRDGRPGIDADYLHERSLASARPEIELSGTCAPCLRPTTFLSSTEGGEIVPGGRRVPNWREELACGCADRLNARYRATLHFLQSVVGFSPRTKLLSFGAPNSLDVVLRRCVAGMESFARLASADGGYGLGVPAASQQVVVSMDALHHVPPLDAALAEFRRVLIPGGHLVFTVPFYIFSAGTQSHLEGLAEPGRLLPAESARQAHEIGWDILDRLRSAGFASSSVYLYRSEELGYLGLFNVLISAVA